MAQSEGWAHFIAAEHFNNRSTFGVYGSYRDTRIPVGGVGWMLWAAPWGVELDNYEQWMQSNCGQQDMTHQGVEWDWLVFFWQLWSNGSERLSIGKIKDIWPRDSADADDEDYNWSNANHNDPSIVESANDELDFYEYTNFIQIGQNAGVDHGE